MRNLSALAGGNLVGTELSLDLALDCGYRIALVASLDRSDMGIPAMLTNKVSSRLGPAEYV